MSILCSANCEYKDGSYCGLGKVHVDDNGCCEDFMPSHEGKDGGEK